MFHTVFYAFDTAFQVADDKIVTQVAPRTVGHIKRLGELGSYNTNHFFRVDRGFVAQTADVASGRLVSMDARQRVSACMLLTSKHASLAIVALLQVW